MYNVIILTIFIIPVPEFDRADTKHSSQVYSKPRLFYCVVNISMKAALCIILIEITVHSVRCQEQSVFVNWATFDFGTITDNLVYNNQWNLLTNFQRIIFLV